jgi:predicted DNA-binding protein
MANQRDKNKRILGVYLDRETYHRLTKLAQRKKTNVADIVRTHVEKITEDVVLSPQERAEIKKERLDFEKKQQAKLAKERTLQNRLDRYKKSI